MEIFETLLELSDFIALRLLSISDKLRGLQRFWAKRNLRCKTLEESEKTFMQRFSMESFFSFGYDFSTFVTRQE